MHIRPRSAPLFVLPLLLVAVTAEAATIHVPDDQPTIQAGIDAAAAGDSVIVAPGTYTGTGNRDISFAGEDFVVQSASGPELTIIDCAATSVDNARGFMFESGESSAAVVSGFTIRNGYRSGGTFPGGFGGGMLITGPGTNPMIENCIIDNNHAAAGGGGLACADGAEPTIDGCVMAGNSTDTHGAGAFASSSAIFTGCQFIDNDATQGGGGLHCFSSSAPNVTDCTFSNNTSGQGGGIANSLASSTVTGCTLESNRSTSFSGGGVYCDSGNMTLTECILRENVSESPSGGSAAICLNSSLSFIRCTLYANETAGSGCVAAFEGANVTIDNTIIAASVQSEAVHCGSTGIVTLTCSDLIGNEGGDWTGCIAGQLGVDGNISEDPLFCNIGAGDLQLSESSPCAPAQSGSCSLIGALDVSCLTAVSPTTWGAIKASFSR